MSALVDKLFERGIISDAVISRTHGLPEEMQASIPHLLVKEGTIDEKHPIYHR